VTDVMRRRGARGLVVAAVAAVAAVGTVAPAEAVTRKVKIVYAQYDSPGSDTGSNTSLNAEWITIQNIGARPKEITGFTLTDETGYTYTFRTNTLAPGAKVRVRSGKGDNTRKNKYWGREWYVWNNTSDKAVLRDANGAWVDSCAWADGDGSKDCHPD
jgi:hypothetical protein